ncbi:antiviral reverse transcriptase Drt4 [Microbulbifer sp. YPW1]|uniref:antiviral reverse transcriptase Drt4 n=1 Tax=Microbulbifer sp. YPW1 TaxID=2745199 RepID=UPI00159A7004|nr:antiviral reverse transcriptase Drt4 [Microbulbifer sp. YPW1]QKX18591.1 RNA-directed DNA polymerase [Microbulbifer sp. YPW1]
MLLPPTDSKRHLYEALTRHNYFPNQKEGARELPPCFSTTSFTPEIVELLVKIDEPNKQAPVNRIALGYDQVIYSLTRHNNVPRMLALPHPKAYALLVKNIYENWDDIEHIANNDHSVIKPDQHQDGRMLVMNYEGLCDRTERALLNGFGMRFVVHTDISSCFHSIYTHSIPWAVQGFEEAKEKLAKNSPKHWSDELDKFQRKAKRNETQGIAIGPGTSTIVVELVLSAVDRTLKNAGYKFHRYIDDYVCYCESHEKAQSFIQALGLALRKFKLDINLHKTHIAELPEPMSDQWVTELSAAQPLGFVGKDGIREITDNEIVTFLDTAVRLNKSTPDGSVVKYAVSYLLRLASEKTIKQLLDYSIHLAWHYPVLIPMLDQMLSSDAILPEDYKNQLNAIALENAKKNRSDGMAWSLYYLNKYGLNCTVEVYSEVYKTRDCMALMCLYANGASEQHIIDFAMTLLCKPAYERDQYWVLLYQIYKDGKIPDPYKDGVFELLKRYEVDFMAGENYQTKAQSYCDYINNPFIDVDETQPLTFDTWIKKHSQEVEIGVEQPKEQENA